MSPTEDERAVLPSASGIERLMFCPGSSQAERGLPELADNEATSDGSKIHRARETGDMSELDDEQILVCQRLEAIEKGALAAWLNTLSVNVDAATASMRSGIREERLWLRERGSMKPLASAKLDVFYIAKLNALVIDLKSGYLPAPPAPTNWQLRTQAVALWHENPFLESVRVAIAQHRFHSKYDDCEYGVKDLEESETEILHGLWRAQQPEAPRVPGEWCRYCRAKAFCREAATFALLPVKVAPETAPGLKGKALKEALGAMVSQMSPKDLLVVFERRSIVEGIIEAVKDRLRGMDDAGLASIGLERQPNAAMREVSDIALALQLLEKNELITVEEFQDCCKAVVGRIEEKCAGRAAEKLKITKEQAKRHIGMILQPAIKFVDKAPSIVKIKGKP